MSEYLIAFAGKTPGDVRRWRVMDGAGRIVSSNDSATLATLEGRHFERVVLVLPGADVTSHALDLAEQSDEKALKIAPFAIEDNVASDIDDLAFALGPNSSDNHRIVYVLNKAWFEAWLEACETIFGRTDVATVDYLLLHGDEDALVGGRVENCTFVRKGDWGATLEDEMGADLVRVVIARAEQQFGAPAEDAFDKEKDAAERVAEMARNALEGRVNLLQGEYSQTPKMRVSFASWRAPAFLAASVSAAFIGLNIVEGIALNAEAAHRKADTEATLKAAFPEIKRVVNPLAQLRAASSETNSTEPDFLVLSAAVASAARQTENLEIDSLRFDAGSGDLRVSVTFSAYNDLAEFVEGVAINDISVTEGGSRQVGAGRVGDVTLRRTR